MRALLMLRELVALCSPACFSWNPIATYESMSSNSALAYSSFRLRLLQLCALWLRPHIGWNSGT